MAGKFHHEAILRGEYAMAQLAKARVCVCGGGAIGSHLVDNLCRHGITNLRVIDCDRVEEHNVGTQLFGEEDVGGFKAEVLRNRMFRMVGDEIDAVPKMLEVRNVGQLLDGFDLIVDGFDNHASRRIVSEYCTAEGIPCLHAGLAAQYGEIHWNDGYRVPADRIQGDVCDYPMARNLILFVVGITSEAILRYLLTGERTNYSFTLTDMKVNREELTAKPEHDVDLG